jgi:hypothetical protein
MEVKKGKWKEIQQLLVLQQKQLKDHGGVGARGRRPHPQGTRIKLRKSK